MISKDRDGADDNEDEDDIAELQQKLRAAELPSHALKVAMKEIKVYINILLINLIWYLKQVGIQINCYISDLDAD